MSELTRVRRRPTQERSRHTVNKILAATEAIVGDEGVDGATTRAISERAGVTAPSLYRFFADRDEILDALLEAMLQDLDAQAVAAEERFDGGSVDEFLRLELDLHVGYFEQHPSLARLWFAGRVSPVVVELVRGRNRALARRSQRILSAAGLVDPDTPAVVFDLVVEYGDRTLEVAFRGSTSADREVIETGLIALSAFAERWTSHPRGQASSRSGSDGSSDRSRHD